MYDLMNHQNTFESQAFGITLRLEAKYKEDKKEKEKKL